MSTFYLAASSGNNGQNVEAVARAKQCMADLEALGLTNAYDWTTNLADPVSDYPKLAQRDLERAMDALVFVLLAAPCTPGGMCELGARIARGGIADVVGGEHLFFHHPQVVRHATWSAFLGWLMPMERSAPRDGRMPPRCEHGLPPVECGSCG